MISDWRKGLLVSSFVALSILAAFVMSIVLLVPDAMVGIALCILLLVFALPVFRFWPYDLVVFIALAVSSILVIDPSPTDPIVLFLLIIGSMTRRFLPDRAHVPSYLTLPLGLFVISYLISVLSGNFVLGSINWIYVGSFVVKVAFAIFLPLYVTSLRALRFVLAGYLFSCILVAGLSFAASVDLLPASEALKPTEGIRFAALMNDPNVFGSFLVPAVIWLLDDLIFPKLWKKAVIAKLVFMLLLALASVLSLSRGTWVNLGVGLVVYLVVGSRTLPLRKMLYVGLALTGILLIAIRVLYALDLMHWLFTRTIDAGDLYRFQVQGLAISRSLVNIFGLGPGQAQNVFGMPPHNLFVQVISENGWLSAVAFIIFIGSITFRLMRRTFSRNHNRLGLSYQVALACWLGLLANSFVIDVLYWRIFWLLVGLTIALVANEDRIIDRQETTLRLAQQSYQHSVLSS